MRVRFRDFDAARFSLHEHPVLVLGEFWSPEEMAQFRQAMQGANWVAREEMPDACASFPGCGNWRKAEIKEPHRSTLVERALMPFVADFMNSFDGVTGGVMSFNYFSYARGDCLSLHSDERTDRHDDPRRDSITRRVALATYFHDTWDVDWGGELTTYDKKATGGHDEAYVATNCISPDPGSLVLFTVPRHHRVCRVDPLAGDNERLSIAGWFMTDHGQ